MTAKAVTAAQLDRRRDKLDARNLAKIAVALLALLSKAPKGRLVRGVLRRLDDDQAPPGRKERKALLAALTAALLASTADAEPDLLQKLREAIAAAILAARGEGRAAALAAHVPTTRDDMDRVAGTVRAGPRLWAQTDVWIQRMFDAYGFDVAMRILGLDEPDSDSVTAAVDDALADGDAYPVRLVVDDLTGQSLIAGLLDLFGSAQIALVDVVTTAGACPRCLDIEAAGPYPAGAAPVVPVHSWCRCSYVPHQASLTTSLLATLI